jgi:hypothetical protein
LQRLANLFPGSPKHSLHTQSESVTFLPHGRAPPNLIEEFKKSALTRNGDKGKD